MLSPIKSNALIANGLRLFLPRSVLDVGGTAVNFLDDREPHMANGPRKSPLVTFVLHETSGNSVSGCKRSLAEKHLGVHLILDKDGTISNHADLATEICWHAGQVNGVSIGMEVVNAYRPETAKEPHGPVLPAEWWTWCPKGQAKVYVAPTNEQMRVALALVPWLCDHLGIPVVFPTAGLNVKKPKITGWRKPPLGWSAKPGPGIAPHGSWSSHADGWYMHEALMSADR